MAVTGYEARFYRDVSRIADALERIADAADLHAESLAGGTARGDDEPER